MSAPSSAARVRSPDSTAGCAARDASRPRGAVRRSDVSSKSSARGEGDPRLPSHLAHCATDLSEPVSAGQRATRRPRFTAPWVPIVMPGWPSLMRVPRAAGIAHGLGSRADRDRRLGCRSRRTARVGGSEEPLDRAAGLGAGGQLLRLREVRRLRRRRVRRMRRRRRRCRRPSLLESERPAVAMRAGESEARIVERAMWLTLSGGGYTSGLLDPTVTVRSEVSVRAR